MKSLGIKVRSGKRFLVLHGNNDGIAVGRNGEVVSISAFYGTLSKGEARKVRKAFRAAGFGYAAGLPRAHVGVLPASELKAAA